MKKIIDDEPIITTGYQRLVFFRSPRVKDICILSWIKLWLFEFLFGVEILEQCQITSIYNDGTNNKHGQYLHLSDFVPAGIFTNFCRSQIYQLLYYKYYKHYTFLEHESTPDENLDQESIDLKSIRFSFRHDQLFQVIAFRRVYILKWVILNFSIDLLVYLSADIITAIVTGLFVEVIRRLIKL